MPHKNKEERNAYLRKRYTRIRKRNFCKVCGTEVFGRGRRVYCTEECYNKWYYSQVIEFFKYKMRLGCSVCGYNRCPKALEFHHPDRNKEVYISNRTWRNENIQKEIDKCILLCSNCHKELHFKEGPSYSSLDLPQ